MQSTIASFQIAAQSAISTLLICDRWGRRGARQTTASLVWLAQVLTSKEAARTYRTIGRLVVIACLVAIALGSSTRDLWEAFSAWADGYVQSCTQQPVEVPPAELEWEDGSELEPMDELLAIASPAPAQTWEGQSIRTLKAAASLYAVPRFNRLRQHELVEVLATI